MSRIKPEVFSDGYRGALITSIAGFGQLEDGFLNVFLKSGDKVQLQFGNDYLSDLAKEKLETYFDIVKMESNPCAVCSRNDVVNHDLQQDDKRRTYCDGCQGFDEFAGPGVDPHKGFDDE